MQYMESARGDEDPGSPHSDEEEDGDPSTEDEAISSEGDPMEERIGPGPDASAEDHGLDATARGSNVEKGGQGETAIIRLSSVEDPLEESPRSSTGSGVPSAEWSVSVETGLRNLKVSEGDAPGKGERTLVMSFFSVNKTRAPRTGFSETDVCSDASRPTPLLFDSSTHRGRSRSRWKSGGDRSGG